MALSFLSPTEIKALSFLGTSKSSHCPKLPGGFTLKRKDSGKAFGRIVQCSAQRPPPAWPGRAFSEPGRKTWDGPKPISVVGSTGSIGTQTLDIVAENPDKFRVVALAAGSNVTLLADQVKQFKPQLVAVRNESLISELKEALADVEQKPEIIPGEQGVIEVARHPDAVTVVTGIVGCAGLKPTVAAIKAGKDIALANKETLIAGGPFVLPLAHKHNIKILPADSEHSAIFQCIQGLPEGALRRIILTASGGAFRDWPVERLKEAKVADALKHPNWSMGKKITVDSATLFNKGLEVIEAHYLFGAEYDNIEIVIHPQSIIHSMVETQDSSVLAQLGWADMRLPILYTMSWPERIYCSEVTWPRLDLCKLGSLTFKSPDNVKYPSMDLAYAAGRAGEFTLSFSSSQTHQVSPSNISFQGLRPLSTKTKPSLPKLSTSSKKSNFGAIKAELNPSLVISLSTGLSLFLGRFVFFNFQRENVAKQGLPEQNGVTHFEAGDTRAKEYVSLLKSNDPVGFNIVDVLAWGSIGHIVAYYILATSSNGYDPKFF